MAGGHFRNGRTGRELTLRVALGALLATTVVALLVGLLINSILTLRNADSEGAHSQMVQLRVSRIQSEVVDLESGLRGYVITEQAPFLQPYTRAAASVGADTDALVAQLPASGIEHARALELRRLIKQYLARYAQPLISLVARHPAAALSVPLTAEGKRRLDSVRNKIATIQSVESARARARQLISQRTTRDAVDEGVVVLVVLVALVSLLAYALQRLVLAPAGAIERAHKLTALLSNASATLDASLELTGTLPDFSRLLGSELAHWALIALVNDDDGELQILAGDEAHLPADSQELMRRGTAERQARQIAVPLAARGRVFGLLVLGLDSGEFEADDFDCAKELARRAGLAVETARLYDQSSATARVLQDSLLPERLPAVPGLEIASRFRPAGRGTRVGGDFYDVFPAGPGTWAILVGDVCGKGAAAAAVTAMVRYTLRAYGPEGLAPAVALGRLNAAMLHQSHAGRFVTIAYATLDLRGARARLTVACGGHPPPLLVRAGTGATPLQTRGTLLGVFDEVCLEETSCELDEGDGIILYSDGVTEARRGQAYTPEELAATIELQDSAESFAEAIDRFATETETPRQDDVAILAVRYIHRSDGLSLDLHSDVGTPSETRPALQRLD